MNLNKILSEMPDCELFLNQDLTRFTTMRLSSQGDLLEIKSVEAVQKILPLLTEHKREFLVVGWGANQILEPQVSPLVIHLDFPFDLSSLMVLQDEYEIPASLGLNHLTATASRFGLKGWEVFTGIPASLGGAIFMNAGTNLGEIGKIIKSVRLVGSDGKIREEVIDLQSFSYRHNHFVKAGDIIVGATLIHHGVDESLKQKIKEYLDFRKVSQPLSTRNCGCVFKNPMPKLPAGKLIDLLGLKGVVLGELRVSPKHANFIENSGAANWDQFSSMVELIKFQMNHFYGIEFELEVKIPYH